jgi:hypothetical protein
MHAAPVSRTVPAKICFSSASVASASIPASVPWSGGGAVRPRERPRGLRFTWR